MVATRPIPPPLTSHYHPTTTTNPEEQMGFIRNAKADMMRKQATEARNAGRAVLTMKLNYPGFKPDFSGEIVEWSMMIEAVESEGWALYHLAGISDNKGRPEALCLFRPAR
jgi:hypothetical protein